MGYELARVAARSNAQLRVFSGGYKNPQPWTFAYLLLLFNTKFRQTDNENYPGYKLTFRKQKTLLIWGAHDCVKLLSPFDPANSGKDSLNAGTEHRWYAYGGEFISKPRAFTPTDFPFDTAAIMLREPGLPPPTPWFSGYNLMPAWR